MVAEDHLEGGPVEQLHDEEVVGDVEDGHDVRMVEAGGRLRLPPEAGQVVFRGGAVEQVLLQSLDRDRPAGQRVEAPEDPPHGPLPQQAEHLVAPEGQLGRGRVDHALDRGADVFTQVEEADALSHGEGGPVAAHHVPARAELLGLAGQDQGEIESPAGWDRGFALQEQAPETEVQRHPGDGPSSVIGGPEADGEPRPHPARDREQPVQGLVPGGGVGRRLEDQVGARPLHLVLGDGRREGDHGDGRAPRPGALAELLDQDAGGDVVGALEDHEGRHEGRSDLERRRRRGSHEPLYAGAEKHRAAELGGEVSLPNDQHLGHAQLLHRNRARGVAARGHRPGRRPASLFGAGAKRKLAPTLGASRAS